LVAIADPFGQSLRSNGFAALLGRPDGRGVAGSDAVAALPCPAAPNGPVSTGTSGPPPFETRPGGRSSGTTESGAGAARASDADDHCRGFTYDGLNRLVRRGGDAPSPQARRPLDRNSKSGYSMWTVPGAPASSRPGSGASPQGLALLSAGARTARSAQSLSRHATPSGQPGLAVVLEKDDVGATTGAFTHDQGVTIMPGVGTILSVREGEADYLFHTFDALGRETRRDCPGGGHAYFEYAACGRRTAMQDATGRSEWSHDCVGQLARYTQLTDQHSYYEYDAAGRKTLYTDPHGDTTAYEYDARDALAHLEDFAGQHYYFEYDAAGRRTVKQLPNGMLTYHGYDAANQLSWTVNRKGDLTHLSSVYYEYDMDSLPAWQYRRGDMEVDHEYVYDLVPRLAVERIRDTEGDLLHSFGYYYDGNSRRTALIREDMELTYYEYNAADELLTVQHPDANWAYHSYDADGNTTEVTSTGGDAGTAGTAYYEWDSENLMVGAVAPGVATANEFEWNADSQRTRKVDSAGEVTMLRDGAKLVAELSGSTWQSRYANEGDSLYSSLLSDDQGGTLRFPSFDLLGTVQSFIGADQSILGTNLFEAYGTRPSAGAGSIGGPYGYVGALGYHSDPDLDALLLSIRHYRPRVGAFVSRDPVRTELTYGYVRGMPGSGVDPTGLVRDPYVKGCSPTETAAILDAWREGCRRVEAGCLGSYFSGSFRACLERECRNGMRPFGILCRPKWYPECWPNIAARAYPCLDIVVCRDWGGSTIVYTELILHELAHHCGALEGGAMLPSAECVEALCFPGGPVPSGCSRHPAPWYKCAASWLVRPGLCYL